MRWLAVLLGVWLTLLLLSFWWEAAPALPDLSPMWVDEAGYPLHVRLTSDDKWRLPPSEEALERLAPLLIAKEDRRYVWHLGVDPIGLLRAAYVMLRGGPRQGGSTIPMQIAQLTRPGSRNLYQKLRQMFYATALSVRYSKRTLLRFYLTIAPFGKNIEGIEAASWYYFQKPAARLTPLELAGLLLISQRPHLTPAFLQGEASFRQKALFWVRFWYQRGLLRREEVLQAEATPLRPRPRPFPFLEPPPLALQGRRYRPWEKPADTLYLQIDLQRRAYALLQSYLHTWQSCGISQGALLIVELPSGKIRAYIGSRSYRSCAIDLLRVRRSPGSTLKPFLYALALAKGQIHSETPLPDVPISYQGFLPSNFLSDRYEGQVSARWALYQSLNLPAVALLREVGEEAFLGYLRELDLPTDAEAGLSLIIGGQPVTAYQLAQAYTTLGTGGKLVRLRLENGDVSGQKQVLDSVAVAIVRRMLPDVRPGWVAKTGTSSHLRDAWCIAVSHSHVLLLWVGNPDASSSACLKARQLLWPLMQQLTQLLPAPPEKPLPPSTHLLRVCPLTGHLASPTCPETLTALACTNTFPLCQHWDTLYVTGGGSYRAGCGDSLPRGAVRRVFPRKPLLAAAWWGEFLYQELPPLAEGCPAKGQLLMVSPLSRVTLWLRRDRPAPIRLQAISDLPGPIHWYVGSTYLGAQGGASAKGLLYWPPSVDTMLVFSCLQGGLRYSRSCRIRWL
jgi:penicillin-binding protein 1C